MAETQSAQNPDSFVKYKQMHKENIELKTLREEAFEKHKHIDLHYDKKY